jgi:hypothetical protein
VCGDIAVGGLFRVIRAVGFVVGPRQIHAGWRNRSNLLSVLPARLVGEHRLRRRPVMFASCI